MERSRLESRAQDAEKAISSQDGNHAILEATIKSAELYMQALKLADTPIQRKRLDAKCKELLDKAERLRSAQDGGFRKIVPPTNVKQPVSTRKLTTRENIILLEGSKLNGFVFKPWDQSPLPDEFTLKDGQPQFLDAPTLSLSEAQLESFGGWRRPPEALPLIKISKEGNPLPNTPCMVHEGKIDLVQDLTSDCSVVASLCAGTSRAERGHSRLMGTILWPCDYDKGHVNLSSNGKYILRFYFNGCWRRVEIDDLLPTSTTSRVLHVVDRAHPGLLWPALLEKAYLKVRGGYDFPGSNSGTDLAVLSGWIPQQVFLHDEGVEPDSLWDELYQAFNRGDNLLTIGTGKLSRREQKQLGLAAEHDYAILEMKENAGVREMLIKNPWADGDVWKGAVRRNPNPNHLSTPDFSPVDACKNMIPGTFWMDFNSVFQYFENMYINWNPGLFSHRQDMHFTWNLLTSRATPNILSDNPQFSVQCTKSGELWVLLNRHFRTGDYTHASHGKNGYISLYLYDRKGHRVISSEGATLRGPFVDSPNTLLRFPVVPNSSYTLVALSQDMPVGKHNFTLSAFSKGSTILNEAQSRFTGKQTVSSAWTRSTAGGNSDSPNYLTNPQFSIKIKHDHQVAFVLRVDEGGNNVVERIDIHVKLLLVLSDGKRITRLRSRDVITHSGDYRRGSAVIETTLDRGDYTIVCSAFDQGQLAKFDLDFYTSPELSSITSLPPESSGRLSLRTGPARFESGVDRMLAPLQLSRVTKTIFIARHVSKSSTSSLYKLSIEQGQGPYKKIISDSAYDSEEFHTVSSGLRITDIDLHPSMHKTGTGGLWLVLERMTQGIDTVQQNDILQVELLAEENVEIGPWGLGDG